MYHPPSCTFVFTFSFSSSVRSLSAVLCPYFPLHSFIKIFEETRKFLFSSTATDVGPLELSFPSPLEQFVNETLMKVFNITSITVKSFRLCGKLLSKAEQTPVQS